MTPLGRWGVNVKSSESELNICTGFSHAELFDICFNFIHNQRKLVSNKEAIFV